MSEESKSLKETDPERYWEERYRDASPRTSGKPGTALQHFVEALNPGYALELGCGKGDDAVWLAKAGWSVVAVDISSIALGYATANADRAGAAERITFKQHHLSQSFPKGQFEIVLASFLPAQPRDEIFRRAAEAVLPGGHLLIIDHATLVPWSSAPPDTQFPTAEETLAAIALKDGDWVQCYVGRIEREVTDNEGKKVCVGDSIIFLQRL